MRVSRQLLSQRRQTPKASAVSVPAPVGGWNTRDALDAMPPTDAIKMDNWFPTIGKVDSRHGYTEHATGIGGGDVKTIIEYHAGANRALLACGGGGIYDATATGAASSLATGFTENEWQYVNFNGRAIMVNGIDAPQHYDGSTVSATAWTGPASINSLISVNSFKSRLYFVEKDSQSFWYGGVNSVQGALTEFPLNRVGQFGGNLMAMGTWTLDAGDGVDDLAVFLMTSGEALVYQGSDPGSATDWALVGVYRIGEPLHRRCFIKTGADLLVATTDDYVSLSNVLKTGQIGQASKLSGAMMEVSTNQASSGWGMTLFKQGNMVFNNVPDSLGNFSQHGMNTITGAAFRFKDIPSRCWGVYDGSLYFGAGDGKVYKYGGTTDNGAAIDLDGEQAWNDFQTPQRKRLCAHRPVIKSTGSITYTIGTGFDFQQTLTPAATSNTATGSFWDVAVWDVDLWSSEYQVDTTWKAASGSGQNLSTRLRVLAKQEISWLRTDYRIEVGVNL